MSSRPQATVRNPRTRKPDRAGRLAVADHVANAQARLLAAGLSPAEAAASAELLARHVLGWDRAAYLARRTDPAPSWFAERFSALVARRARRVPAAYLTGTREFWTLAFRVTPAVLIPRPETELLVEAALAAARARPHPVRIADVGTGSGCVAIALARALPHARLVATDISREALEVARLNAEHHGVADRVRLVRTDLLAGVRGEFDLVVCNPPYVATEDWPGLPPEVREYEPRLALDGGPGGLAVLARLAAQAAPCLAPRGLLIVEIGAGQERTAGALLENAGWRVGETRRDLQGWVRVLVAGREVDARSEHDGCERPARPSRKARTRVARGRTSQGAGAAPWSSDRRGGSRQPDAPPLG